MPTATDKKKKITGSSIEELNAILQNNVTDSVTAAQNKTGDNVSVALDRIKARVGVKKTASKSKSTKKAKTEDLMDDVADEKSTKKKTTGKSISTKKTTGKSISTKKTDKKSTTSKADEAIDDKALDSKDKPVKKKTAGRKASSKKDITMGELLEQGDSDEELSDTTKDTKGRRLKNISETIRADREKRKNDAALVMATITGNQQGTMPPIDRLAPAGFPVDVSNIDFEKERYDAEEACIDDFKRVVNGLAHSYEIAQDEFDDLKSEVIDELVKSDRDAQEKMKDLKVLQSDLVNRIAELHEVIAVKNDELNNVGITQFYKKSKIKQILADSENEVTELEMEALKYNGKLLAIVENSAKKRAQLYDRIEAAKQNSKEAQEKLNEAMLLLQRMETREYIDENAVQKKLILNALRLYPKPMTIGQLLYYPGLSGYSVQKMSAAISQLVTNEQSVLKVALEDNVYYLIASVDDEKNK